MTERVSAKQIKDTIVSAYPVELASGTSAAALAMDLLDARAEIDALRAKLDKVCDAGEYLLDANRTVNIYANDEWRTRRGALEDAITAARAGGGE